MASTSAAFGPQSIVAANTPHLVIAADVDEYSTALPGLALDVVRTGPGSGPNVTRSIAREDLVLCSVVKGFPTLGRTDVAEQYLAIALVTTAPPGGRWCGVALEPGTIMVYGPGAEHVGADPVGLAYSFALIKLKALEELAESLQLAFQQPERGSVAVLAPTAEARPLTSLLFSIRGDGDAEAFHESDRNVPDAVLRALADGVGAPVDGRWGRLNSRRIVNSCIEYANALTRNPSLSELCVVANVSERRLRAAFVDALGVSPLNYFRARRLDRARQEFSKASPQESTVTGVARDLGFDNLSRFAKQYRSAFGELPSKTLASLP